MTERGAIHGTVFERPWEVASATEDHVVLTIDLGPAWPFRGAVTQSIELGPGGLDAHTPMTTSMAWRWRDLG